MPKEQPLKDLHESSEDTRSPPAKQENLPVTYFTFRMIFRLDFRGTRRAYRARRPA
jgi:hypothetical protein